MNSETDIKEVYELMENGDEYLYSNYRLVSLLGEKSGEYPDDSPQKQKILWEIEFFRLRASKDTFDFPIRPHSDSNEPYKYYEILGWNESAYEYLIQREAVSQNPFLKSRYSHILWNSPKKHGKYAKSAIKQYLNLSLLFEQKDSEYPNKHFGLKVKDTLISAYTISLNSNQSQEEVRKRILELVLGYSKESSSYFRLVIDLIELIISTKKMFNKEDYVALPMICWENAKSLENENLHFAIKYLELGEKIETSLNHQEYNWRNEIALIYEKGFIKAIESENYANAVYFCDNAIEQFKILKDEEKVFTLSQEKEKYKGMIKYTKFEEKIDLTEHSQHCKNFAQSLLEESSEGIIGFIASDIKSLLPNTEKVKSDVEEISKTAVFSKLVSTVIVDKNQNITRTCETEDKKETHAFFQQYKLELEINKRVLIDHILFEGIKSGKISTDSLIQFFVKNSWLGEKYQKYVNYDEKIEYCWLDLLIPSIDYYFNQIKAYQANLQYQMNLVLCIDSLTPKIEGVLRNFCKITGEIITSYKQQDGVEREKYIDELLREEKLKNYFDKDEINFFRFVLTKDGYNIRNDIAHAFFIKEEYHWEYMNYLIIIILRIGKYQFIRKE